MIVYNLACDNAHRFEGWFSSAEGFDAQSIAGLLSCPVCGSVDIVRQPSAPYVSTRGPEETEVQLQAETTDLVEVVRRRFIEHVIRKSEDVGNRFPEEARRIHYREVPVRSIRGQASRSEVDELREEGIEVLSIPGLPVPPDQLH
jgi:hypothetical protein